MRNLLVLVGAPLSGKTSWVKENKLSEYTLSLDTLRVMYKSPISTIEGKVTYNEVSQTEVVNAFFEMLKFRMSEGSFTVLDNMHIKIRDFKKYADLASKYGYRLWVKDFRNEVDIDEALKRNSGRTNKFISNEIIMDLHDQAKLLKIPNDYTPINKLSEIRNSKEVEFQVLSEKYEGVYYIGDIHGCIDELNEFLDKHYNSKNYYVFTGDYIDRGPDSPGVISRLNELYYEGNVTLIEGNHEKWLRYWVTNNIDSIRSKEFMNATKLQLESKLEDSESSRMTKKSARSFLSKLSIFSSISLNGIKLFACHGGLVKIDDSNSSYSSFPASNYISGAGGYKDLIKMYETDPIGADFIIHGHRNKGRNIQQGKYINLEGSIENGGNLRSFYFGKNGERNEVILPSFNNYSSKGDSVIQEFRSNSFVKETKLTDSISAFNFTREAFFGKEWNNTTVKARGIFINTKTNLVEARSYNKFFNTNEVPDTTWEGLKELDYPIIAREKGNGYLGLASFNSETGELFTSSKSTTIGPYADKFREALKESVNVEELLLICKELNVTFVFEVIEPSWDPHIIRYDKEELILLDIIRNEYNLELLPSIEVAKLEHRISLFNGRLRRAELKGVYHTFEEMVSSLKSMRNHYTEGLVLRSANGFMFKYKTPLYGMIKTFRGYLEASKKSNGEAPWNKYMANLAVYNYLFCSKLGSEWGIIKKEDAVKYFQFIQKEYMNYSNIIDLVDSYTGKERLF